MADRLPPQVPRTLKNYRLKNRIGVGGMGAVYEAEDRRDHSRVALKLLHAHLAEDAGFRERFEREAHVAALLRSPYTVHLLDFGEAEGFLFLVMEFVEGRSLANIIESGPIEPARALRIASDVARALEEAEARGVIHRDIKPENILISGDETVKVADFGIARRVGGSNVTEQGGFVGSVLYASPEQAKGEADRRSDVYALGGVLYAMLAGNPPYSGAPLEILRQHAESSLPVGPLASLPDAVVNIVRRCLEKDPQDRYQSASELAGALERAQRFLVGWERDSGQGQIAPSAAAPDAVTVDEESAPTRVGAGSPGLSGPAGVSSPAFDTADIDLATVVAPSPETSGPVPTPADEDPVDAAFESATVVQPASQGTPPPEVESSKPEPPPDAVPVGLLDRDSKPGRPSAPASRPVSVAGASSSKAMKYGLGAAGVLVAAVAAVIVGFSCFGPDPEPSIVSGATLVAALDDDGPDAFAAFGATTARRIDPSGLADDENALEVVRVSIAPLSANRVVDFVVFPTSSDARSYASELIRLAGLSGISGCVTDSDSAGAAIQGDTSTCYARSTDVVVIASALVYDSLEPRENEAQVLLDRGLEVVRALRAREVPASATAVPLPTATPTPTRAPTQPPPPTPVPDPPITISAGEWNYLFTVLSNTCTAGGGVGTQFPLVFLLEEATPNDNLLAPGELVKITEVNSSFAVGTFTFTSPIFNFSYPVVVSNESGVARVTNTYTSPTSGTAMLQETYVLNAGGNCVFTAADQ